MLLLVLLLAVRAHACPMLFDVDPSPSSTHDCYHDTTATSDIPAAPTPLPCHDGACLQASDFHGIDHGPTGNQPDRPMPLFAATILSPPAWLNGIHPLRTVIAVTPRPLSLQRSRVLRL